MSSIEQQIQILESEQLTIKKEISIIQKKISLYGFDDCKSKKDFELKKIEIKNEIKDIQAEILKAGSRNDRASVIALKNREGVRKTQLLEIDTILVLMDDLNGLKIRFRDNEEKINYLIKLIPPTSTERQQMDKFLEIFRTKSCKQAASEANIEIKRIVNWLHEGRDRTNENKIYFYKEFNKIKNAKSLKKTKIMQMRELISLLNQYKSIIEACDSVGISVNTFNKWYIDGRNGKGEENIGFYREVRIVENRYIELMRNILDLMSRGKTRIEASRIVNVPISTVNLWYEQGKYGYSNETVNFYKNLKLIEQSADKYQKDKMDMVLDYLSQGKSMSSAAENADVSLDSIQDWYGQGSLGYSKNTIYFYKKYNEINDYVNQKAFKASDREKQNIMGKYMNESRSSEVNSADDYILYSKGETINSSSAENNSKIKSCPKCGSKVDIEDKYCLNCGYAFDNSNKEKGFLNKIQKRVKKWF